MSDKYPLFIKWRGIVEYLLHVCGKYPKSVRFNLCDRITNLSLDILELIVEAIYSKERETILQKINLSIEKIRALMQISLQNKYISMSQYEHIMREIDGAGKMVGGWIKHCGG